MADMKICSDPDILYDDIYIFDENNIVVKNNVLPEKKEAESICTVKDCREFFSEPDFNYSAFMLRETKSLPDGFSYIPLRQFFFDFPEKKAGAARAHGFLKLRELYKFCPSCGGELKDDSEFTARRCVKCGNLLFPRIEPAIIVLVHRGAEILLVRNKNHTKNFWACVAGFVEMGETVEDCVHREVREETGLEIKNVVYRGSQSWPFPDQLMLAFTAEYDSGEIRIQEEELSDARWFKKDCLPEIPKPGSVAWNLINDRF